MRPLLADFERQEGRLRALRRSDELRALRRRRFALRARTRGRPIERSAELGRIHRVRLALDPGQSLEEVLAAYRRRPDVEYAELNPIINVCVGPNDSQYEQQWALNKIRAPETWDTCHGSHEVVVAVIDTGVDYSHRDLQGNLWVNEVEREGQVGVDDDENGYVDDIHGYNFVYNTSDPADDHGHGTHCAGIVAAVGNNETDITGVCWTARVMSLKILGADGDGSVADAVPAIYYAVANGADVISGSWGGEDDSSALREAVAHAHAEGVIIVAAAGNENSDVPYYPGAYSEVICVAATDSSDRRWYLSNYGDWVDIAAPGRDVLSLRVGSLSQGSVHGTFTSRMSGTSMAAPHVAGTCALLLSAHPLLTGDELLQVLLTTADPIAPGICSSNGRLNLYEALRAAIPPEGTIRLERAFYTDNADVGVLLADWDLRGTERQTVLLETGNGDSEVVTLDETAVSLGVFRGGIVNRSGVVLPNDGVLQATDKESIVAGYLDGEEGGPQAFRWREARAVADYSLPFISQIDIEPQRVTARMTVRTSEPTHLEVWYGTTCGGPYTQTVGSSVLTDRHAVELRDLTPNVQYCFVVNLVDAAGNEALVDNDGQDYSFVAGRPFRGFLVPAVYPTIQQAIDEASDGDTIWVSNGTYAGQGNVEVDFRGKAITVRSEKGPTACIIDCQGEGRAFHFHGGEAADSILDGFTFTRGGDTECGGAVCCTGSSPTIRNCLFLRNGAEQCGGGLCNRYGSHPAIMNCTFRENSCSSLAAYGRGGGMANRQGSNPIVTDCVFVSNSARYSAGAMGNFDASSPLVTRCAFRGNSSDYSAGAVGNRDGITEMGDLALLVKDWLCRAACRSLRVAQSVGQNGVRNRPGLVKMTGVVSR